MTTSTALRAGSGARIDPTACPEQEDKMSVRTSTRAGAGSHMDPEG
jgi:hypothetical protein